MESIVFSKSGSKRKVSFKAGLILILILSLTVSAFGEDTEKITEIRIVTPAWEGQTNEDGTGLYFDIVRSVYEPLGIKMTYEIVPWKRAELMINRNDADAMLCAQRKKKRLTPKYPMFVENTVALFKKENIKEWKGIETLRGKRAVWIRGYDLHMIAKLKHLNLEPHEVNEHRQAWKLIEKGTFDFYIDVLVDIDLYIRKNKPDMTPYQIEILDTSNAYMSFAKTGKSDKLIEIYDKRIMEIFKSGELKKMYEKWNTRFSPGGWEE